jgi:acyl carrier protein
MTDRPWPAPFEEILRQQLPTLRSDAEITPDLVLADAGLNSLRLVALLIGLEDTFDVVFPDELLAAHTFRTVDSLWSAFQTVTAASRA